jgi:hypothetical protein
MTNISVFIYHVKTFINTLIYRMFLNRTDSDLKWNTDYTDKGLS